MEGEERYRSVAGGSRSNATTLGGVVDDTAIRMRIADQVADGVDGELIFPNGAGQFVFGTTDPVFVLALSRCYIDWV